MFFALLERSHFFRIIALLLAPIIFSFLLAGIQKLDGANGAELFIYAIIGLFGGVFIDVFIIVYLINETLIRRYSIFPAANVSIKDIADIISGLEKLPDRATDQLFVKRILHGAVAEEIKLMADPKHIGRARFSAERLDSFYKSLNQTLGNKETKVWATCFTEMPDFWAKENVGKDYLHFNIELANKNNVSMERVFHASSVVDFERDGNKKELIRILSCFPDNIDLNLLIGGNIAEDMFLILDKDESPLIAIQWEIYRERLQGIEVIYDEGTLNGLKTQFMDLKAHIQKAGATYPISRIGTFPFSSPTPKAASDYWRDWVRFSTQNQTSYLNGRDDGAFDPESISVYWDKLEHTLIRPPRAALPAIKASIDQILAGSSQKARSASFGATPETRAIFDAVSGKSQLLDVIDLSLPMLDGMNRYLDNSEAASLGISEEELVKVKSERQYANHEHVSANWLSLNTWISNKYSLVFGVDVINMFDRQNIDNFVEVMHDILVEDGCFLTQVVHRPSGKFREKVGKLREMGFGARYLTLADEVKKGVISEAEAFSTLIFTTGKQAIDGGECVNQIELFENTLDQIDQSQLSMNWFQRWRYCNSLITLRSVEGIKRAFVRDDKFTFETIWQGGNTATHESTISWYLAQKR